MSSLLDIPNRAVLMFLQKAVDVVELRSSTDCTIYEFDACQYYLARNKSNADLVSLSFNSATPAPIERGCVMSLCTCCAAVLASVSEPGYQVTLQVRASVLMQLEHLSRTERKV